MLSTTLLPYETQPQGKKYLVGNEICGTISIPMLWGLTPNELKYFKELTVNLLDIQEEFVKLCNKISKETGQSFIAVYNEITTGDFAMVANYIDDILLIEEIGRNADENANTKKIAMAAVILKFRVVPTWTIDDCEDPEKIHPLLVQKIAEFGQNEMQGWKTPEPITEESLKKIPMNQTG